jgi:hypothetical protein
LLEVEDGSVGVGLVGIVSTGVGFVFIGLDGIESDGIGTVG